MSGVPLVWAQATTSGANSLGWLALRRWCSSLTLASPDPAPSLHGLWVLLAGLAGLLILAMVAQGPARALGQAIDVPGHLRLFRGALERIRRSGRVIAVTIGLTVFVWTAFQIRTFNNAQGRDDLVVLTKSRSLVELAVEQGVLAGLTPLRDVLGLADNLVLLLLATILVFRSSADRWTAPYVPPVLRPRRPSSWANAVWGAGAIYMLYRIIAVGAGSNELPLPSGSAIEVILAPLVMALLDGALLAWVLVELRNASLGDTGNELLDTEQAINLLPGAALACIAGLPARYVATSVSLLLTYLPTSIVNTPIYHYIRWQLSWGLADFQAAALMFAGMAGAVAWSRGSLGGAVRGFGRLLSAEGGHLTALVAISSVLAGALSGVAYLVVLALPAQTWVLAAADSYAHYATLPIGLFTLAALVELAERSLPLATLAAQRVSVETAVPEPAAAS